MRKEQVDRAHTLLALEKNLKETAGHALIWSSVQAAYSGTYPTAIIPPEFEKPMMELLKSLIKTELLKLGVEND